MIPQWAYITTGCILTLVLLAMVVIRIKTIFDQISQWVEDAGFDDDDNPRSGGA